jgi:type II secretory pathway component PulJ
LMELIVAIAVSSILLVGIMTFLVNSLAGNAVRTARADMLREAQLALDVMVKDIRLSANAETNNRIEDDNSPNAIATAGLGWESNASTLVLAVAAQDSADNIIFTDAAHYITEKNNIIYYVSDSTLYKRSLASSALGNDFVTSCPPSSSTTICPADRLSVKNVQSLVFKYYDSTNAEVAANAARSVEATLTLSATKYGRTVTVSYSTRTVFRNE